MKPFSFLLPIFWSVYLHLLVLFTLNSLWLGPNRMTVLALGNQTDHLALLKFKESISNDPYGILDSWNSSTHFCNWHGITCNPMHQRIVKLNLQGSKLHGSISPHVGNLSYMRNLNLGNNNLYGNIPQELGHLLQLQLLVLVNNSLSGEFPTTLTKCYKLLHLDLADNNLIGKIPIEIGSLWKLQKIFVEKNNLTGQIPPSMGNLSSLTLLSVGYNNLEGIIPRELWRLENLKIMAVHVNKLVGMLPSYLYNMSSLIVISAANNQFNGSFPPNMFLTLPNLQKLYIGGNQISGLIPTSIANASVLQILDIGRNHFIGQVPSLGKVKELELLALSENNLGGNSTENLDFLKSLTNSTKLQAVYISNNNFRGHLPIVLGNLSNQLSQLHLGYNQINGKIPEELESLNGLIALSMDHNHFEGIIPMTFGKFKNMQVLDLSGNELLGDIPTFLGNLSQLSSLDLSKNSLEGKIPPSIGNCQMLQYLHFSENNLTGIIPSEVFSLSFSLNSLDLSQNSLSGGLPNEVSRLQTIDWLDVSENNLSGEIPRSIEKCTSLEYLYLQGNYFHGNIPTSLASLKGLQYLDLSRNHLSGSIPDVLQNISFLQFFNVSFNMLNGEVPREGVFKNASKLSVIGNNKLCGGVPELNLPLCPIKGMKLAKHHNFMLIAVIVSMITFFLILPFILITIYCVRKISKKRSSDSPTIYQMTKVSYQDLHQGTNGFSARNLIGVGGFGSVYKGNIVQEDEVVAIKVLNLQKKGACKSFITECNALKNIRHRNLVKILTCCSSTDYKGQEFKALVFEYMKNGSLEEWLHLETRSAEHKRILDLNQRLNIIIDVAFALHYLHHECEQPILHCDLKPSNVLLDDDMVAHVSDFGIARLVSTINNTSQKQTSTIGIKGTIGYAPPEYGVGSEVSTHGDMYSFGILMLELLTGRRPTDEIFKDGQNLHNIVEISFPDNLFQILDPQLVQRGEEATLEEENNGNPNPNVEKTIVSLFRIGLACSNESPKERMSMVEVTRELNLIKSFFPSRMVNGG